MPQPRAERGSQRWIQDLVNNHRSVLDDAIGARRIDWRSPLAGDDFAEYRDDAFLELLGVALPKRSLPSFWPPSGPQWDALGRAPDGEVVLLEAKAHVPELLSPPSAAGADSLELIRRSLEETARGIGALPGGDSLAPGCDWAARFYQFSNRLAHAYLLNILNGVRARLVFLYLVGDREMRGPATVHEWEGALRVLQEALGVRGRMPRYVTEAFVDISGPAPIVAARA